MHHLMTTLVHRVKALVRPTAPPPRTLNVRSSICPAAKLPAAGPAPARAEEETYADVVHIITAIVRPYVLMPEALRAGLLTSPPQAGVAQRVLHGLRRLSDG